MLRYGVQPDEPGPGLVPGCCFSKAHDREHLGIGGRRVLVSRDWSGKTLAGHSTMAAALIYHHATDSRARQIADRLSEVVEREWDGGE